MHFFRIDKHCEYLIYSLLFASLLCLLLAISVNRAPGDTAKAARKVERILTRRTAVLDSYTASVVDRTGNSKMNLLSLPGDMVIYCYEQDTLKAWRHQFPVRNDDIGNTVFMQRLTNPRNEMPSPLSELSSEYSFISLGPSWYIAKCQDINGDRIISGLEISNSLSEGSLNGVNPHLKLGDRFSVKPLATSGGSAVSLGGVPLFKVVYDSMQTGAMTFSYLMWIAYALFLCGIMLSLHLKRNFKRYFVTLMLLVISGAAMILWGRAVADSSRLFSPALYADKFLFSSLGAVLLVNLTASLVIISTFMLGKQTYAAIVESRRPRLAMGFAMVGTVLGIAVLLFMAFTEYKSITLNSSISLELYELSSLSAYSVMVYISLILLMSMTLPLLLLLRPYLRDLFGINLRFSSYFPVVLVSILLAVYMVILSAVFGMRKEQAKVSIWANRLSIERDIELEMRLRTVEESIATDSWIQTLVNVKDADIVILNRITDSYLFRPSQDYDISVHVLSATNRDVRTEEHIRKIIDEGTPICEGSRVLFSSLKGARASYCALFSYYHPEVGVAHMLLELSPKASRSNVGYRAILGSGAPSRVTIPSRYSYAKYTYRELVSVSGGYTYPIVIKNMLEYYVYETDLAHVRYDGYCHFINRISENETIIISRPQTGFLKYCFASAFLSLLIYLVLSLIAYPVRRRYQENIGGKTYYKSRVSAIMIISLIVTLIVMTLVSVAFVYQRNDTNLQALMLEKIDAVQSQMYQKCMNFTSAQDMLSPSFYAELQEVGMINATDINLYTVDGKVFLTTAPEMFERLYLGSRMDEEALYNIRELNKRFFISIDHLGERNFYTMYTPAYNEAGDVLAIMAIPYSNDNYDFEKEAVQHLMIMFTMFLILLLLARFAIQAVVERLFMPLGVMSRKMSEADINTLEYIDYDNDDEISALVDSYNRMVTELSESSQKLAEAERDKAWSAMARQVAHEIKNPLTPMKLQLQRIIRLKQKNDPAWQERFDEMTSVVLDHIDMLSETANEFSTFAKLYTEEPSEFNLDRMLQEEIAIFDNHDDGVEIEYRGFGDAVAVGPKPQLARVFINLLGNAVQAVGGSENPKVLVSLRKSSREGFYDIVFEDNGPGVAEENRSKLFTPNFTTKSGGTGLGLAISKSVLDKCGATISYSRSFSLGGACFTIVYPENA